MFLTPGAENVHDYKTALVNYNLTSLSKISEYKIMTHFTLAKYSCAYFAYTQNIGMYILARNMGLYSKLAFVPKRKSKELKFYF